MPLHGPTARTSRHGRFGHDSGSARLSGLVNLARLASDGEITFDCVFVVDLD